MRGTLVSAVLLALIIVLMAVSQAALLRESEGISALAEELRGAAEAESWENAQNIMEEINKKYGVSLISSLESDEDLNKTDREILEYLKKIDKENVEVVLNENEDLTKMHDIAEQIEEMKDRKIWLKCGGFITIDKTEALTAIDINSGKFTGKKNSSKENTIYKVNQEATVEIAKQLRLRNISGIIVIDYIDMEEEQDRRNIMNLLEKELKKDRSKTQIMGFTKLDLLEMTRKKL